MFVTDTDTLEKLKKLEALICDADHRVLQVLSKIEEYEVAPKILQELHEGRQALSKASACLQSHQNGIELKLSEASVYFQQHSDKIELTKQQAEELSQSFIQLMAQVEALGGVEGINQSKVALEAAENMLSQSKQDFYQQVLDETRLRLEQQWTEVQNYFGQLGENFTTDLQTQDTNLRQAQETLDQKLNNSCSNTDRHQQLINSCHSNIDRLKAEVQEQMEYIRQDLATHLSKSQFHQSQTDLCQKVLDETRLRLEQQWNEVQNHLSQLGGNFTADLQSQKTHHQQTQETLHQRITDVCSNVDRHQQLMDNIHSNIDCLEEKAQNQFRKLNQDCETNLHQTRTEFYQQITDEMHLNLEQLKLDTQRQREGLQASLDTDASARETELYRTLKEFSQQIEERNCSQVQGLQFEMDTLVGHLKQVKVMNKRLLFAVIALGILALIVLVR